MYQLRNEWATKHINSRSSELVFQLLKIRHAICLIKVIKL
jgi:hypothetical protein